MSEDPLNKRYILINNKIAFSQNSIVIFLGICLAWIGFNTINAFPSVDDFCYGARAIEEGLIQSVSTEYSSWSGRYSATFFMSAFAGSSALLKAYFLVPLTILIANLFAAYHFLTKFSVCDKAYKFVFFMALISVFSFRESVFWLAGGFTYGLASAIFLVLIAQELNILFDCLANKRNPSLKKTIVLCATSLLLAGFNETVMVAHIALLGQIFLFLTYKKRQSSTLYIIGAMLFSAIAGALIVKYAPGISARATNLAEPNLMRSIGKSFGWIFERYTHIFLISWLLFYSSLIVFSPQRKTALEKKEFFITIIFLFFTLWAALFTRAYALNGSGPSRTHGIDLLLVSLIAFFAAWHAYQDNKDAVFQSRKLKPIFMSFAGIFITIIILRPGADNLSFAETLKSFKYSRPLKEFMLSRFKQAQLEKSKSLEVADFPNKNRSVTFFDDIQPDSKDWRNICFANYFQLIDVRLKN